MAIRHLLLRTLPFIATLTFFLLTLTNVCALVVLPDGRQVHIIKNDILLDAIGDFIVNRVEYLATSAIATKGTFSMSIGSGTTVAPLAQLADRDVDMTKVHILFGNERTEGEQAGKCFKSGSEVFHALGIPEENIHSVPHLPAEEAAETYEAFLRNMLMPKHIIGTHENGMPCLDLCLLGSGADGHCASLYPNSPQVSCSSASRQGSTNINTRAFLPAEGKGGITITIDAINSARNVIVSAGKATQSDMARKCLGWSNAEVNTAMPAGMIGTSQGAVVEWILSQESAADLPAM
jgi:6-phosphogluconolactonase